jgi:DNA-directed RNA polymerase specialized sigma24 family protein
MDYISDQALVAYSKINKSSYLDIDDLVNMGMEVYFNAVKKWNPVKSKFNTFLINCLKNYYGNIVRNSFAQRRGGLGTQYENGKEQTVHMISNISIEYMAESKDDDGSRREIMLVANRETDTEYGILLRQIAKKIPSNLRRQFIQMTDPDKELIEMAYQKSVGKNKCDINDRIISEYLGIPLKKVKENKLANEGIVAKIAGYNLKKR